MATLGYDGEGAGLYSICSSSQYIITKISNAPYDGQVHSISIYIHSNGLSGLTFRWAIYDTDGNRLYADTSNRNYPSSVGYAWRTYTVQGTKPFIAAGTSYYICQSGQYSGSYPRIAYLSDGALGGHVSGSTPFPATVDFSGIINADERHSMYITYSPYGISGDFTHVDGILNANIESMGDVDFDDLEDLIGLTPII